MTDLSAQIRGLVEAQAKLDQTGRDLRGEEMQQNYRTAAMLVSTDAKILAPVDRGGLRASITPTVRVDGNVIMGVVGSNLDYAPYMETGTRPHWPPLSALAVWARRHGTTAFVVARAISRRGVRGRHYLQGAFEKNKSEIMRILERGVKGIVDK